MNAYDSDRGGEGSRERRGWARPLEIGSRQNNPYANTGLRQDDHGYEGQMSLVYGVDDRFARKQIGSRFARLRSQVLSRWHGNATAGCRWDKRGICL